MIASTSQSVLTHAEINAEIAQMPFVNAFCQSKQHEIDAPVHATYCSNAADCRYDSCRKIKSMAFHSFKCELKSQGKSCTQCNHLKSLCFGHAEQCTKAGCRVMLCQKFRESKSQNSQPSSTLDRIKEETSSSVSIM